MAQKTRSTRKKKPNYSKRAKRLQRELLYSFFLLMAVIILLAQFHSAPAHYRLVVFQEDGETDTVQYYTSFKTAQREMNKLIERGEFNPAVLDEQDNIIAIKYGIVNFRTKTCGENTSFKMIITEERAIPTAVTAQTVPIWKPMIRANRSNLNKAVLSDG